MTGLQRALAGTILALATTGPLAAQGIPVVDAQGLAEIIKVVRAVQATQTLVQEELSTVQRLSRGYGGNMSVYRIPAIPTANHDVGRYTYAGPLLQGLNTGDPRGDRYNQVVRKVDTPGTLYTNLSPDAQRQMEAHYATLEIYDATATLGVHQAAMSRVYGEQIAALIAKLEADITNPGSEYHQATAIADNLSVAALIAARQNQSANQTDSSILEQLIARNKRTRDAAVASNNMAITALKDKGTMSKTVVESATSTLRNWRLP